jgi:hypothetical protein
MSEDFAAKAALLRHATAGRDKDNFCCDDCGRELQSWSSSYAYDFRKIPTTEVVADHL